MNRYLEILGDGQVWDLKGIKPEAREEIFEDLFSGRALGRIAEEINRQAYPKNGAFSGFKEKKRVTGISVTRALLSDNSKAKKAARRAIESLAKNGALGIAALTRGKGFKKNWPLVQKNHWKGIDSVVIGGGVSEDKTGKILVSSIERYLAEYGLSKIRVFQAKFPGKEAGFLGAVTNIITKVIREARVRHLKVIGGIGLDLGRDEIGVGLLKIDSASARILRRKKHYWLFKYSAKTPYKRQLKNFLDSRRNYTIKERKLGERIRLAILEQMADLILRAQAKANKLGLACSRHVGVAVPGSTRAGYIINSTDYLPFFRKEDGFNFKENLERVLAEKKLGGLEAHLINDGIAAGIANIYIDPSAGLKRGKIAFLGVGSGLGGCVGLVN